MRLSVISRVFVRPRELRFQLAYGEVKGARCVFRKLILLRKAFRHGYGDGVFARVHGGVIRQDGTAPSRYLVDDSALIGGLVKGGLGILRRTVIGKGVLAPSGSEGYGFLTYGKSCGESTAYGCIVVAIGGGNLVCYDVFARFRKDVAFCAQGYFRISLLNACYAQFAVHGISVIGSGRDGVILACKQLLLGKLERFTHNFLLRHGVARKGYLRLVNGERIIAVLRAYGDVIVICVYALGQFCGNGEGDG